MFTSRSNRSMTLSKKQLEPFNNSETKVKGKASKGFQTKTKGPDTDVLTVNLNDVRTRLQRLHNKANTPIRNLDSQDKDDFMKLHQQARLLYNTPDFKAFHDEVRRVFGNVTDVAPGTVGAYFNGVYIAAQNSSDPGCSILAAGSLPPPKDEVMANGKPFEQCKFTVMWAIYDGSKYQFINVKEVPNKDNVIIYVDNPKGTALVGFSDDEKKQLAKYGAKNVDLMKYSQNGKVSQELLGGFVPLEQLPSRDNVASNYQQTSSSGYWIGIILLIVLILIVIWIGWRMSRKPGTQTKVTRRSI